MAETVTQMRPSVASAASELDVMQVAREQLEALPGDVRASLLAAVKTITHTTPAAVRERASSAVDQIRQAMAGLDDAARQRVLDWANGALVPQKKGAKK